MQVDFEMIVMAAEGTIHFETPYIERSSPVEYTLFLAHVKYFLLFLV
jgi:hypothetical protein